MVVCGLASVDLSSLTGQQQAILFVQMCLGNPVCKQIELAVSSMDLNWGTGPSLVGCGLF